jgi:hypothetical protein
VIFLTVREAAMSRLCEDCGAHASYAMESVRDATVVPPDRVQTAACEDHRQDVTERALNAHGNVTVYEVLG